jgi:hypothetical protein
MRTVKPGAAARMSAAILSSLSTDPSMATIRTTGLKYAKVGRPFDTSKMGQR